jgi:hypothetical protein
LREKTQVVAVEVADVVDAVNEHGYPLRPHPEGHPREDVRVVPAVLEDGGVHHAGAADFEPPRPLADAATLSVAENAVHVEFHARFGKGEIASAQPYLPIPAEHLPGEGLEHSLEVGQGNVGTNRQPLDLEEHELRTGRNRLVAVHAAGEHNADRPWCRRLHGVNLPRRGVGAEQDLFGEVEGVPHVPGGVVRRHVEKLEVVAVALHLGTLEDFEAHAVEDTADLPQREGGEMQAARGGGRPRQGDVDPLRADGLPRRFGVEVCLLLPVGLEKALLEAVDLLADARAVPGGDVAEARQEGAQFAAAAEPGQPPALERLTSGHEPEFLKGLPRYFGDFSFHFSHSPVNRFYYHTLAAPTTKKAGILP